MTVLAYQVGAGAINPITPADDTLMAVLALAGVRVDRWFRFADRPARCYSRWA